ncbi:MAG: FHA domain-containing protein [Ignavibacteria bacterium]|nr:FHA domain-containing protein [Ignavibacteria bacterium]
MSNYKCVQCQNVIYKPEKNKPPDICVNPDCNGYIFIESDDENNLEVKENKKITLKLIYLKTGEEIKIETFPAILGVENIGWSVFQKAKNSKNQNLISRKHCEISIKNENILIKDLGSTNGTFLEAGNTSEKVGPEFKSMEKADYLLFGRERMSIQIIRDVNIKSTIKEEPPLNESEQLCAKRFKCKECGREFETNIVNCEKCGAMKSIIEII